MRKYSTERWKGGFETSDCLILLSRRWTMWTDLKNIELFSMLVDFRD